MKTKDKDSAILSEEDSSTFFRLFIPLLAAVNQAYEISDDLCDYFDFAEFGAHMADEKSGQFVNGGFIFCDVEDGLDSIMDKLEDESSSMTMGGM